MLRGFPEFFLLAFCCFFFCFSEGKLEKVRSFFCYVCSTSLPSPTELGRLRFLVRPHKLSAQLETRGNHFLQRNYGIHVDISSSFLGSSDLGIF